jgi:hypothetical protein
MLGIVGGGATRRGGGAVRGATGRGKGEIAEATAIDSVVGPVAGSAVRCEGETCAVSGGEYNGSGATTNFSAAGFVPHGQITTKRNPRRTKSNPAIVTISRM